MSKKKEEEQPQYDLGLKESRVNRIRTFRQKTRTKLRFLGTKGLIRSPYPWFFICLCIALIAAQIYWIYTQLPEMPSQIPLYLNQRELAARLAPNIHIYIYPLFSATIFIATAVTATKFYYVIKNLANYGFVIGILSVAMLTYGLFQIISYYHV